jgi:hypothetical protein
MPGLVTSAGDLGASLRRRVRRRGGRDWPYPGAAVPLRRRLFVTGTDGGHAFRGRATAVAVDGTDTHYLVEDAEGGERWVAEDEIDRFSPFAPGDAVIGYVTVRGARPGALRAPIAAVRRAAEQDELRLAGVVCDDGGRPVADRPGLRRALDRIAAGEAAGLIVADLGGATGADDASADLLAAVRHAGGAMVALETIERTTPPSVRHDLAAERAAAQRRIDELRAAGMAPRAIAVVLNAEGVPTLGREPRWHAWSVREAGSAWPPRGPAARGGGGRPAAPGRTGWTPPAGRGGDADRRRPRG